MLSSHRHTLVDQSHGRVTLMPWLGASRDEREKAFRGNQALAIVERWRRKGGRRGLVQVASWLAADRGEVRGLSEEALVEQIRKAVRAHRLIALPGWVEARKRGRAPLVPMVEEVVVPRVAAPREATASDAEPTIRLVNLESRYFVPGKETVRVSYAIDGPVEKAASVKLVVKSLQGGPQGEAETGLLPATGNYSRLGAMNWGGRLAGSDELITLAGSPYQLAFELTSTSGRTSTSEPAIVELEVHSISVQVDENGALPVESRHRSTLSRLVTDLRRSGMPRDCSGRVLIDSPVFPIDAGRELKGPNSGRQYAAAVGDGVAIPLLTTIRLKSKTGGGLRSPEALRGTWVTWEASYETAEQFDDGLRQRGATPEQRRFLAKVANHDAETARPTGLGTHRILGGRRDFPVSKGHATGTFWRSGPGWAARQPSDQPWLILTECGGTAEAALDTAVYFLSGRIAGDTHRIHASLPATNATASWDADGIGPNVAVRSSLMTLTNWRRVAIVGDWFVGQTEPLDVAEIRKAFEPAALSVELGPDTVTSNAGVHWTREYRKVVDSAVALGVPFLADALDREHGDYAVQFRPFAEFKEASRAPNSIARVSRRIQNFFFARNEEDYRRQCEQHYITVFNRVAETYPLPDNGITVMKFAANEPHNQRPSNGGVTAGFFEVVKGRSTRHRTIIFQFTNASNWNVTAHEIGHALFLEHAPGHSERVREPDGVDRTAHEENVPCLMAYLMAPHFCGLCLMKLAGARYEHIGTDGSVKD